MGGDKRAVSRTDLTELGKNATKRRIKTTCPACQHLRVVCAGQATRRASCRQTACESDKGHTQPRRVSCSKLGWSPGAGNLCGDYTWGGAMRTVDGNSGVLQPVNRSQRLTLLELMILIAGVAVGLWLFAKEVMTAPTDKFEWLAVFLLAVLGGLSVVGPPFLLLEPRRRWSMWRAGKVMWFSQGMASWLLWPPIIYARIQGSDAFLYCAIAYLFTPLMGLCLMLALLAGGWLRGARGRYRYRSWREQFGLLLGSAWACMGFYVLYYLYSEDFG